MASGSDKKMRKADQEYDALVEEVTTQLQNSLGCLLVDAAKGPSSTSSAYPPGGSPQEEILSKLQKYVEVGLGSHFNTNDFLPLLEQCLKPESGRPMHKIGVQMIHAILMEGKKEVIKKLGTMDLVPQLVGFVKPSESDADFVADVTLILSMMANHPNTVESMICKGRRLTRKLLKFLQKGGSAAELVAKHAAKIVTGFVNAHAFPKLVEIILPLVSVLFDVGNEEVIDQMLRCLCMVTEIIKSLDSFIKLGLSTKLVQPLTEEHPKQNRIFDIGICLGNIALLGPVHLFEFLESLKGAEGLKHYWKCLNFNETFLRASGNEKFNESLCRFVNYLSGVICSDDYSCDKVNVVIDAGYAHALAGCAKQKGTCRFRIIAIQMLGNICASGVLPADKKRVIEELDLFPVIAENLKDPESKGAMGACMLVMRLTEHSAEQRDIALSLGVLPPLLRFLQMREQHQWPYVHNSIQAIESLLRPRPSPPIQVFKDILLAIRNMYERMPTTRIMPFQAEDINTYGVECLREFTGYGHAGIDAIFNTPRLTRILLNFLREEEDIQVQGAAIQLTMEICEHGSSAHRQKLLEFGALENFKYLFMAPVPETRKVALETMKHFLGDELTSAQKKTMDQLRNYVLREIKLENLLTKELGRSVYMKMIS